MEWIPYSGNEADMFMNMKKLDEPLFRCYAELLLGKGALSGEEVITT